MSDAANNLIVQVLERRVPQILAIYVGSSWAVVEFADFMVAEFLLSPRWTRVVLTGSVLLIPSPLMLAWNHGKPGRDRMTMAVKVGISANVAFCVAFLWVVFAGTDLGAATTAVTVETEEGEVIERVVVKAEFRKRVALFPLDAGPGLEEGKAWVAYAVPLALEWGLLPDDFFQPVTVAALASQLHDLGFDTPRNVPLALMREVAEEQYAGYLVAGSIDRADDRYRVTLTLHEVADGSLLAEADYEGPNLLALVDEMSVALKTALEIPAREGIGDLPVRERLTSNSAAWEEYVLGMTSLVVDDDLDASIEHMTAATRFDHTFTGAHRLLAGLLLNANRQGEALAAIEAAMDHLYRLPERVGFAVKREYYYMANQVDRAVAVAKMWVDLHPGDVDALRNYLFPLQLRGDWEGALATLNEIYRLTPRDAGVLEQIAAVYEQLGDPEAALAALTQYIQQRPDDHTGYMDIAAIHRRRGEHDLGRENIERAILIQPLLPELTAELAELDTNVGRFDDARGGYERALELARTPGQRADVLRELSGYYRFRGEMENVIRTLEEWFDEVTSALTPIAVSQARFPDIDVFFAAGRNDAAVALFEELSSQLEPPVSEYYVPHWAIHVALGLEDVEGVREAYERALDAVEANQFEVLVPTLTADLGRIQEAEGDYASAAGSYRSAMDMDPALDSRWRLGRALRMAGRLDEAEDELEQALGLRPAAPHLHLQMGYVREARGDIAGAVEHLRSALVAWENAADAFEPAREAREKLAELGG